jgi:hypothetical protein
MNPPNFDHVLMHRVQMLGNGAALHKLINRAAAYNGIWHLGNTLGWTEERVKKLEELETKLRKYLNEHLTFSIN